VGAVALGMHVAALVVLSCFLPVTVLVQGNASGRPALTLWFMQLALWVLGYLIAIPACMITGRMRTGDRSRHLVDRSRVLVFWSPLAFLAIGIVMAMIGAVGVAALQELTPPLAVLLGGSLIAYPLLVVNHFVVWGLIATAPDRSARRRASESIVRLVMHLVVWCIIGPLVVLFMLILMPPEILFLRQAANTYAWVLWSAIWMSGGLWYAAIVAGVLRRVLTLRVRLGRLIGI
jgi:hypothetical protein